MVDGVTVRGPEVIAIWKQTFEELGNPNFGAGIFDSSFAASMQAEVAKAYSLSFNLDPRGELDSPIQLDEVQVALDNLKRGKACGIDGIVNEILAFGGDGGSSLETLPNDVLI